jgi:hypothetical protein
VTNTNERKESKMKKFARNKTEAKKLFKERTHFEWNSEEHHNQGRFNVTIFKLSKPTPKRKFFVGTHFEWMEL